MIIPANSTSHALWGIQLLRISANPKDERGSSRRWQSDSIRPTETDDCINS